jgi:hypothetical protein
MNLPLPASWSPRRRKALYWSACLLLFYTVFGFLILPLIVRAVAVKQLSKQLDRSVSIQKVKINPYTLSATIRGLLISDPDGQPFVSWHEVYANFQLLSFVTKPWVFKEVSTSAPYIRAEVRKDYTLNFSDLIDKFSKAPKKNQPSKPAALRVDLLRIRGAKASFTDLTPREPFRRIIGPLEVTLTGFHTDPNNRNPYSFAGTTDSGERFSWSGHFYLDPIRSEGEISLDGISLPKYAPLYQDLVRFDIRDGTVSLRSTYRVVKSAATNIVSVTNTSFRLDSFKLAEKNAETNIAELSSLLVSRMSADVSSRSAEIGHIRVDGARLMVQRNKDASINMLELAQPAETATNAPGGILLLLQSVTNAFAMLLQSTNLWSGTVHEVAVTNCSLRASDLVNSRPVDFALDHIWLAAKNISNLPGRDMSATLSLNWETNGAIHTDIKAGLLPQHAEVKLALENLTLRPLDPYLEPKVNVLILNSKLGMNGVVRLSRTNESLPEVTFHGDVHLDDFSSIDGLLTEDLLKWGRLRITGIEANLNPPVIGVSEVSIDGVSARLIIDTNGNINVMAALRLDKTNTAAPPLPSAPGRKPMALLANLASKTNGSPAAVPAKISIASIVFTNTDLQFTDRSLRPNVDVTINNLSGVVAGITSDELQRADVNLRGMVDKTGLVEITGKLNPLNQKQPTELKIAIKNVDLHPAGPYSGKFAGYRLNKGQLSMDLNYHIEAGQIKSENIITVDQLMLGEKVESPDALKLPIRLAVAVLKDRNGRIQLDVPIEGSLDDPQFRLGKVIRMAIVNVLTRIVTSPFAALGAIFGGKGEEISFQEFSPGATDLSAASIEKLDALVKGLFDRPGLQVEVEGSIDPEADRAGLQRQKLYRDFQLKKWKSLRRAEQARLSPHQLQLTPQDINEFTTAAYTVAFSPQAVAARAAKDPNATPAPANARQEPTKPEPDATSKGATALVRKIEIVAAGGTGGDLEMQLLQTIDITPDDFDRLAADRAKRVKDYIVEQGQVEAERIFLSQSGNTGVTSKGPRVYLHLR